MDGDFYDFITIDSQCLDVVVGDVTGKGIASALMGAALKSYFLRVITSLDSLVFMMGCRLNPMPSSAAFSPP